MPLLCALGLVFWPGPARAQGPVPREYPIKAVFLFNFLQFVEWPETAFPSPESALYIGVLGEDPFGAVLDEVVEGEALRGRRLVVRRSRNVEELLDCQLLFVSRSEAWRAEDLLRRLGRRPVLTVGDFGDFAREGGMLAFYADGRKVRFEVNPAAAREAGLKLSSQLLELGRRVGEESGGAGR